jgi:hypothetical protein
MCIRQKLATGWQTVVLFLAGAGFFSVRHRVQTSSGTHHVSYQVRTKLSFLGSKSVSK